MKVKVKNFLISGMVVSELKIKTNQYIVIAELLTNEWSEKDIVEIKLERSMWMGEKKEVVITI